MSTRITKFRDKLNARILFNERCDKEVAALQTKIEEAKRKVTLVDKAIRFVNEVAMGRRKSVIKFFRKVIGDALTLIYQEDWGLTMDYSVKYNRPVLIIKPRLHNANGYIVERESDGFGGGVQDTIASPMRMIMLYLTQYVDNVLFLDENWKHMDSVRIERVGKFLRLISEQLGIQIIFFTHHEKLEECAHKAFELSCEDGVSSVGAKHE